MAVSEMPGATNPDPEDASESAADDGPEMLESEHDAMTRALTIAGSNRNSLARIIGASAKESSWQPP